MEKRKYQVCTCCVMDTTDEDIVFDEIGKECINKINGEYIKQKYNIKDMKDIGDLLRKERIEWIKKNVKRD